MHRSIDRSIVIYFVYVDEIVFLFETKFLQLQLGKRQSHFNIVQETGFSSVIIIRCVTFLAAFQMEKVLISYSYSIT